jgi:hypothetical protein
MASRPAQRGETLAGRDGDTLQVQAIKAKLPIPKLMEYQLGRRRRHLRAPGASS